MTDGATKPGRERSPGIDWFQLAEGDSRPLPDYLKEDHYRYLGSAPLDVDRYISAEFFGREIAHMWPNVWQYAARDEDLLSPGDSILYENAGRSYVLVRQPDHSVRAFHNVCLHRGRKLRQADGRITELRCGYHAFSWNLDGSLKRIPCRWDFGHLSDAEMQLPEAQVGRWGGYIFVKEAAGGPTLEEYLGPLPAHFERWQPERCRTVKWAGKVIRANWKVCMEAFMEALHVIATHPQIMPFTGDANTKYDIYNDHVNLALTPFGVTSPNYDRRSHDEQWVIDQFLKYNGRVVEPGMSIDVDEGRTARQAMGDYNRARFGRLYETDLADATDSEVQDAYTYNVFPNFSPWGGVGPQVVYRWRPWPDHEQTLMEVRLIQRMKPGEDMTPAAPMRLLAETESWVEEFGQLGAVLEQDMANIPYVQEGMRLSKTRKLHLANYQEIRIRHFHQTLDKYLGAAE